MTTHNKALISIKLEGFFYFGGRSRDSSDVEQGYPALISLDEGGHWAVVYGYSRGHIFVSDSSLRTGLCCRMPVTWFQKQWDGWMMAVRQKSPAKTARPFVYPVKLAYLANNSFFVSPKDPACNL